MHTFILRSTQYFIITTLTMFYKMIDCSKLPDYLNIIYLNEKNTTIRIGKYLYSLIQITVFEIKTIIVLD